ncbi:restriction endonuclease subunit S [Vibrio fluvialis]
MSNATPRGWSEHKLGKYIRLQGGNAFKSEEFSQSGIPVVRISNIKKDGSIVIDSSVCVAPSESLARFEVGSGDVLIAMSGATTGKVGRYRSPKKSYLNQRVGRFLPKYDDSVSLDYVHQMTSKDSFIEAILIDAIGGAQPNISSQQIESIVSLFPPLPEQKKIAAILTSVDDVIEKTQAQIDKLKDLKAGMMQELLTRGVGVDGKPYTEFKDSPVGRIPKGWEVLPLANVVERVIDCEHKTAPYVEKSEFMVVRTSNVRSGELLFEDMKFTHSEGYSEWTKRAVPSVGDVLFTREAPAGESCLVPEGLKICMGQRMVLLRPNRELVHPCFFSMFLTSEAASKSIYELSIGTTVSRINIEDIKRIPCMLPPLDEQLKISRSIQSVQRVLDTKQRKLLSLQNNKKALMQDLLTGKVRVKVDS